MKDVTKELLTAAMKGIPPMKRKLDVDISHPNDDERLMRVSISLLDNDDSIDNDDILSVCEDIGEEYSTLISDEDVFIDRFADVVFSRIDDVKNIIDLYRSINNNRHGR